MVLRSVQIIQCLLQMAELRGAFCAFHSFAQKYMTGTKRWAVYLCSAHGRERHFSPLQMKFQNEHSVR